MPKVRDFNIFDDSQSNKLSIREIYIKRYGYKIGNKMSFLEDLVENSIILGILFIIFPIVIDVILIFFTIMIYFRLSLFLGSSLIVVVLIYQVIKYSIKDIKKSYQIAKKQ